MPAENPRYWPGEEPGYYDSDEGLDNDTGTSSWLRFWQWVLPKRWRWGRGSDTELMPTSSIPPPAREGVLAPPKQGDELSTAEYVAGDGEGTGAILREKELVSSETR